MKISLSGCFGAHFGCGLSAGKNLHGRPHQLGWGSWAAGLKMISVFCLKRGALQWTRRHDPSTTTNLILGNLGPTA